MSFFPGTLTLKCGKSWISGEGRLLKYHLLGTMFKKSLSLYLEATVCTEVTNIASKTTYWYSLTFNREAIDSGPDLKTCDVCRAIYLILEVSICTLTDKR